MEDVAPSRGDVGRRTGDALTTVRLQAAVATHARTLVEAGAPALAVALVGLALTHLAVGAHAGPTPPPGAWWLEELAAAMAIGWTAGRWTWLAGLRRRTWTGLIGAASAGAAVVMAPRALHAWQQGRCAAAGGAWVDGEGLAASFCALAGPHLAPMGARLGEPDPTLLLTLLAVAAWTAVVTAPRHLLADPAPAVLARGLAALPAPPLPTPDGAPDLQAAAPLHACARETPWGPCGQLYAHAASLSSGARCVRCGWLPVPAQSVVVTAWAPTQTDREALARRERQLADDGPTGLACPRWRRLDEVRLPDVLTVRDALTVLVARAAQGTNPADAWTIARRHAWATGPGSDDPVSLGDTWQPLHATTRLREARVGGPAGALALALDVGVLPVPIRGDASAGSPIAVAWVPTRRPGEDPTLAQGRVSAARIADLLEGATAPALPADAPWLDVADLGALASAGAHRTDP